MGNVALGGSKRQSYSPGEAKGTGQATAAAPENGNVVKAGANGQVGGAGKDDVTEQHDVIVADDNSGGNVTPSSTVPATPTTSSPGSPLSPTEKKTKRKVPRFVFSLRRTGSGKRSRKPRTEANGVRPVSYPAALGVSGSNPTTNEKGRPQSLLFEEITIPEDDGKIETVSLSSNDDNTEKDRSKDLGDKPSSPTCPSPKTPPSKKDKKKESSQKTKSSKKKKEKESKPKAEKQRKGSKDRKETSPEESPQERKKSIEETIAAVVVSMEENIPSRPNEEKATINEEVFVATSAQAEETLPSAPKNETPLVQEVMVVEVVKPNEQTPESKTEECELNDKADDIAVQLKSSQVELKESQPEEGEALTKQDEENAAVETETKQEEISEIKHENKLEHTEETDTPNDDKLEEEEAVSIKIDEGKPEEVKTEAESEEPKPEEAKVVEVELSETSNFVEEEDKEAIKKEAVATEELVGMVIQPSVAAMPNTEMKIEGEQKLETEHTTVTADISEALLQPQAETEQTNGSQAEPDSQTTVVAAVVEEIKQDLELVVTGPETTKDSEDEITSANKPSSETIQPDVTQIVPVTQDSTELTKTSDDDHNGKHEAEPIAVSSEASEPVCQETAKLLSICDGEDVSGSEKEEKIVEEVIEETMSVQVHARVHAAPAQPAADIKPEQQETPSQLPLIAESSPCVPVNEADSSMEQSQAPDSEKEAQATAVSKEVAESMNLNPPASFIPEGEIQATGENSPPLSPSQIKALEKERKAAKKREDKEKARKEKEDKKRLKELKKQEAKEKKLKEKEEKERKLRELREKGKAVVAENTEVKTEETSPEPQSPTVTVTGYVPCSPANSDTKQEEQVASSSEDLIAEPPSTSPIIIEVKQEEMDTVDASLQNVEPKTEVQPPHKAKMTPTPALSISADNAESSLDIKVEPLNDTPLPTDNQDTVAPAPSSDENIPRQSTSSTSSSSESSSCPPTPATPDSPFSDPQSPEANRSGDSTPTSPTSPDTSETARSGALKKIELGPRLRTAILRKSSSGAESEEKRVSLTQPRFVQTSQLTPPPRKQRPRRPLEQVWSPLGDYASNRARNAKSSAQKEASAVLEEEVVVTKASNTESAHVETPVKADDKSTSHRTEAADIPGQEISVTASVDTETKSTSAVQNVSIESESSNLGAEVEESMTVSVASIAESVPATNANVEINQPQEAGIKQSSEKSAFVFETPPPLSSTENADDSHENEVTRRVKPDNDNDYKVMCDLPSSGSRVSIHSDPSSPTIVSVASIVLSGQPETPDTLSPSDSPHQPPELQKPDDEHRGCEPEREAENVQKEEECEVNANESIPVLQETADAGLQAMAEDMVSQANEEAQVEVVKLISEEKADQSTGHVTENATTECDISDQVADVQREDIEHVVNVNCDVTGLTSETTESQKHQTHSEEGVVRDDDMGMVCVGSETLVADCEKTPSTEENKVQQSDLEGCGSSVPEETVTVTVDSVVSSTSSPLAENQLSSAGACEGVSDLSTEGASFKKDDCSETKDCPKNDAPDMEVEPPHSSQLESSQTTATLQASIAVHSQSENMITSEEEEEIEEPPSGTPCVLIPEELLASLKKEAELSAESEGKVSTENEVQMEVETTVKEQLEDSDVQMEVETTIRETLEYSESKTSTENNEPSAVTVDADVSNTEEHQCTTKNDQTIIVAADEHKADLETREPDADPTVQSLTTQEENSGEVIEDQQCPETQPEHLEQSGEVVQQDTLDQSAGTPADQDVADPKAEILADVSSEVVEQHLNGDKEPEGHDEQAENKAGGKREEVRVTAQCNGSHELEANSSDTIDAYLKLQAGAEEVQKNVHAEKLQGGDVTGSSTRTEAGMDETDKAVSDASTSNSND